MSKRVTITLPASSQCQSIAVFVDNLDKAEREAVLSPSNKEREVKVKLPDGCDEDDCLILIRALNAQMKPVGLGHVYDDGELVPYHPEVHKLPRAVAEMMEVHTGPQILIEDEAVVEIERPEPVEEDEPEVDDDTADMGDELDLGDDLLLDDDEDD